MKTKAIKAATFAMLLAMSHLANAGFIYTYTGNNFTTIQGGLGTTDTTSDSVTAILTLDEALGANINRIDIRNLPGFNLKLTASGQTFDSETALNYDTAIFGGYSFSHTFFSTSETGAITNWEISATTYHIATMIRANVTTTSLSTFGGNIIQSDGIFIVDENTFDFDYRTNSNSASTWVITQSDASAVPEPSTFAIFALGLIGLASRRFKK